MGKSVDEKNLSEQAKWIVKVSDEVKDLLIRKNADYGDSFSKQFKKYGIMSALIRIDDKISRLETLTSGHTAQVDESIEDSLLDLVGYATLAVVELRKSKEGEND